MPETICPHCNGEGCHDCKGVGVLGWEPPPHLEPFTSDYYDVNRSMIQNFTTHTLTRMARGEAGEYDSHIKQAQRELARRRQDDIPEPKIKTKQGKLTRPQIVAKLSRMHKNAVRSIAQGKSYSCRGIWIEEAKRLLSM